MDNTDLINQIKSLIDKMFGNTSVDQSQTREDLIDIIEHCEELVSSID